MPGGSGRSTVKDLAPGPHKLHSRATDANGMMQPTADERRKTIASGREDFSIWTREITVWCLRCRTARCQRSPSHLLDVLANDIDRSCLADRRQRKI